MSFDLKSKHVLMMLRMVMSCYKVFCIISQV